MKSAFLTACFVCLSPLMLASGILFAHEGGGQHRHDDDKSSPVMTTRSNARVIAPTAEEDAFQFIVYGDRTGGVPAGLKVLEQAVVDTNLLDPDLVMTVGDLIQGYNETNEWLAQAAEYRAIMKRLKMPWFPVAGNHDIYWRGRTPAPPGHHEANYEKHFGPLWYSFRHKNAGFIVLYSDEGDPESNLKAFNVGALQRMSETQLAFLDKALQELADQDHVFVFLHHPRWIGGGYSGSNWDEVHKRLAKAGNVSAVFAGHIHRMRYDDKRDGIEYFALATTGGHIPDDLPIPGIGHLHHFNVVTVRPTSIAVASLPVGAIFDPKQFTPEFLAEVDRAKSVRPTVLSDKILLETDGTASGNVTFEVNNSSESVIEYSSYLSRQSLENDWHSTLEHPAVTLKPGETSRIEFMLRRGESPQAVRVPELVMTTRVTTEDVAIELPAKTQRIPLTLGEVPSDYFRNVENRALKVIDEASAVFIQSDSFELPDGPFTLECWIKPAQHRGYEALVAKTENSEYAFFAEHGAVRFDVHLDGNYVTAMAANPLAEGQWSHLAGVFDGTAVKLFIDGKLVGSKAATGKRRSNSLPLYLGADPNRSGLPTRGFVGQLDELRLSRSVRYREEFTPARRFSPDDDTVLLHHLDRQVGPFVLDHSSSAAAGLLGPHSELVPVE